MDPNETSQRFNGFFSGVGPSLAQKILPSEKKPEDFTGGPALWNSSALITTTTYEIIELATSSTLSTLEQEHIWNKPVSRMSH